MPCYAALLVALVVRLGIFSLRLNKKREIYRIKPRFLNALRDRIYSRSPLVILSLYVDSRPKIMKSIVEIAIILQLNTVKLVKKSNQVDCEAMVWLSSCWNGIFNAYFFATHTPGRTAWVIFFVCVFYWHSGEKNDPDKWKNTLRYVQKTSTTNLTSGVIIYTWIEIYDNRNEFSARFCLNNFCERAKRIEVMFSFLSIDYKWVNRKQTKKIPYTTCNWNRKTNKIIRPKQNETQKCNLSKKKFQLIWNKI